MNQKEEIKNFYANIIPFGSYDVATAIDIAIEVGEDGDWVAEEVRYLTNSYDVPLEYCDVVCIVYNSILQEARNEIDNLIDFDFCNDGADIYTSGNYIATSYDWSDNANEKIKNKLIESEILFEDLSKKTQWFLTQINANY